MNLTIIIDSIPSKRAKNVIARHLAHGPSISLTKANQMVESGPFVYAENLSKTDAARELANLKKLGCRVRLVRTEGGSDRAASPPNSPALENKGADPPPTVADSEESIPEGGSSPDTSDTDSEEEGNAGVAPESIGGIPGVESATAVSSPSVPEDGSESTPDGVDEKCVSLESGNHSEVGDEKVEQRGEPAASDTQSHVTESARERRSISNTVSTYTPSAKKKKNRVKQVVTSLVLVLCVVLPVLVLTIIQEPADRRIARTDSILKEASGSKGRGVGEPMKPVHKTKIRPRSRVSKKQKLESTAYVDSASDSHGRYDIMIRFYMIAISFNPYNIQAWYGLIAALEEAGRSEEAQKARRRMEQLFGREIFDVRKLVAPYGTLIDFSSHGKRCRVEYRATPTTRDELERDAYQLARAFRAEDKCRELVLHAETGLGSGMVTRIKLDPFPQTMSHFRREAKMMFAD